jgi:hypothetical protein
MDNRPLKFDEFEKKINQVICVSATPSRYEIEKSCINYQKFYDFDVTSGDKWNPSDECRIIPQVIRPT